RKRRAATRARVVLEIVHRDVDRIDRHRRRRRIRRRSVRHHRAEWQEHQAIEPGRLKPATERIEGGAVADPPAVRGGRRKERQDDARVSRHYASPPLAIGSTRSRPSRKMSGLGSRLTTRNAPRAKSKKYPGCTRTCASRILNTSASSLDVAGTS